jgi:hypothetical protein
MHDILKLKYVIYDILNLRGKDMKIVCTLKEFELLLARCPMHTFLINNDECEELLHECHGKCMLSNFCRYGMDDGANFSLADLVEIVQ